MKLPFYFLFLLPAFIAGCKKDKTDDRFFGTASAVLNGTKWKAGKVACGIDQGCNNGKLSIQLLRYNNEGHLRENVGFAKFTPDPGQKRVYPLNYLNACNDTLDGIYNTVTDDGDVTLDFYNAVLTSGNYLKIEKYDEDTKELWGTFSVTYVINVRQSGSSPDTIRLTDGTFYTRIME